MTVKIYNLRYGFATNSSSSHSIVYFPETKNIPTSYRYGKDDFGWENFVLTSIEDKNHYLLTSIVQSHVYNDNEVVQKKLQSIIKNCFGKSPKDYIKRTSADNIWAKTDYEPIFSIDHNSHFVIPLKKKLISDLIKLISDERVVIFGGNDNEPQSYPRDGAKEVSVFELFPTITGIEDKYFKYRYDEKHKVHTFFDGVNGFKARFSVETGPEAQVPDEYNKAELPELVDLKITNYCPFGCEFCYQSSTAKGVHAPLAHIKKTIKELSKLNVFEIAIGGGEPTFHPDFAEILEYARKCGIVPNFTTFSTHWLKNETIVKAVLQHAGAIGVSVHTINDLSKVAEIKDKIYYNSWLAYSKVVAQVVLGAHDTPETADIIQTANKNRIPLLFLGYKSVGFGETYNYNKKLDEDFSLIFNLVRDASGFNTTLSIDTAVVQSMPKLMKAINPEKYLVTSEEGKFSMYIDAVDNLMGPSSYVKKDTMIPFTPDNKDILKAFREW